MTDYGAFEVEAASPAPESRRAGGFGARVAVLLLGAAALAGVARLSQGGSARASLAAAPGAAQRRGGEESKRSSSSSSSSSDGGGSGDASGGGGDASSSSSSTSAEGDDAEKDFGVRLTWGGYECGSNENMRLTCTVTLDTGTSASRDDDPATQLLVSAKYWPASGNETSALWTPLTTIDAAAPSFTLDLYRLRPMRMYNVKVYGVNADSADTESACVL